MATKENNKKAERLINTLTSSSYYQVSEDTASIIELIRDLEKLYLKGGEVFDKIYGTHPLSKEEEHFFDIMQEAKKALAPILIGSITNTMDSETTEGARVI